MARARGYLWEGKNQISQSVKQVFDADVDLDLIICMLTLRALCEQVTLTTAGANTGIDVYIFINMAVIWTLADLQILDLDTLDKQERTTFTELILFDTDSRYTIQAHKSFLSLLVGRRYHFIRSHVLA